jgi:type II secretory pathway component PulK
MLAMGVTDSVRTQVDLVENAKGHLEAEALADAAIHISILSLMEANRLRALSADSTSPEETLGGPIALIDEEAGHWGWSLESPLRIDATPYLWEELGGKVTIHFEAERGKLDLNAVPADLLLRQLEVLGVSQDRAGNIVEAFEQHRLELSERIEHAQGTGRADKHSKERRPFTSVDEFRSVNGVTRAAFALLEPYLTVYSGRSMPDPTVASMSVLAALEDAPRSSTSGTAPFISPSTSLTASESTLSAFPVATEESARDIYTIRADATTDRGYRFVREAVVELPQGKPATYYISRWIQGMPREEASVR